MLKVVKVQGVRRVLVLDGLDVQLSTGTTGTISTLSTSTCSTFCTVSTRSTTLTQFHDRI